MGAATAAAAGALLAKNEAGEMGVDNIQVVTKKRTKTKQKKKRE